MEEIGQRLVKAGHEVTVYCRGERHPEPTYLGMKIVHLPAVQKKVAETLSHTTLSVLHSAVHRPDAAIVFNAANAPLLPLLRLLRIPVATHVDGLEWKRAKWEGAGQKYYKTVEKLAVRWSDALISDARGIVDYYRETFGASSVFIPYGAPILTETDTGKLREAGYEPGGFHLIVARFEPENHLHVKIQGYRDSAARLPLVVVGSAPYSDAYTARLKEIAGDDPRIRFVGGVWDQALLDAYYAGARTYLHGHSVGGTNPSLLRAMGAGASVLAWDVNFNREVLAESGRFFDGPASLAALLEAAEAAQEQSDSFGELARKRAAEHYVWDDVASSYERLCQDLKARYLTRRTIRK
ncbi:glycosyltransferase [Actinocorallia lasiicapitis]